jgi:hypothetical protein
VNIPTIREQALRDFEPAFQLECAVLLSILLAGAVCLLGLAL